MKTNTKTNLKRTLSLTVSGLVLVGLVAFGSLTVQAQETEIDAAQSNSEFDSMESSSKR